MNSKTHCKNRIFMETRLAINSVIINTLANIYVIDYPGYILPCKDYIITKLDYHNTSLVLSIVVELELVIYSNLFCIINFRFLLSDTFCFRNLYTSFFTFRSRNSVYLVPESLSFVYF